MAKTKMLCPFSNELCRECAQYRGRHYYLCFCKKYRGALSHSNDVSPKTRSEKRYVIPPIVPKGTKLLILDNLLERSEG